MSDTSDFAVGTTYAGMAYFDELTTPVEDPRPDPMDYAATIELGNGTRRGVGWMKQTLHWDILSEDQRDQMYAFCGSVFVRTMDNSGDFGVYTALWVWPEEEPEHSAGYVLDLTIELRKLVEYTPS